MRSHEGITSVMDAIVKHVEAGFHEAGVRSRGEVRIGAELKFPLVNRDGTAVDLETVDALWTYLASRGWQPVTDSLTGKVVGATKPGEQNDTVASCETGFCKPEFSLAHVANLLELEESIHELREGLAPFCEKHAVYFLGYGIQPVTPPSDRLMMKKTRTSVWDKVFGANRVIPEEDGDDVCLFTINAATHVHVSVSLQDAIAAVNVLNGFASAQIALTADSNIWRGELDPDYKCVAEKFWDWWMPDANRVGIPAKPFRDLEDYVETVARLRPVYVKRVGKPIVLKRYETFEDYFRQGRAVGIDSEGREVSVVPETSDIDVHNTCYWYNARLSQHYTVENRVNDQQSPDELTSVAALTLGLVYALAEAQEEVSSCYWNHLRAARETACRDALEGRLATIRLSKLAGRMLEVAELGLRRRGLGEERFLVGMQRRLQARECPADEAARTFEEGGIEGLLAARRL